MYKKENLTNKLDEKDYQQNFPASKSFFTAFQNINKNLIIQNHNIQITETTPEKIFIWINKLEYLFDVLYSNNYILSDNEKMEIAIMKTNEELFSWYFMSKGIQKWSEFKGKILLKYTKIQDEEKKLFCINNWVKIFDSGNGQNKNTFETGLISKVLEDGFYEVVCKGKVMKIHEISLEEY